MISDHDDHDGSDFNAVQHKSHDNFGVESDDTIIYGSQVKFKNLVGKDRKQILGAVSRNPTFSIFDTTMNDGFPEIASSFRLVVL